MCVCECVWWEKGWDKKKTILETHFVLGTMLDSFIHIEFSSLTGGWGKEAGVGGLGEEGELRGTVWLYSSCFYVVWNFYMEVKLSDVVLEILKDLLIVR